MSRAYYNENDPKAAAWLRELIKAGLIASGDVDERSITEVQPDDLTPYGQCHFFAGIGGWSYALRLAGVPDSFPVWTGSCPCQPFSAAGKQLGEADERHLWPTWFRIISKCRPAIIFGEQVASKAGREWYYAGVRPDLEGVEYAVGCADLCAASVKAPHIRQRLWWMAYSASSRRNGAKRQSEGEAWDEARMQLPSSNGANGRLGDTNRAGLCEHSERNSQSKQPELETPCRANADRSNPWAAAELIHCLDGKARRIEPGSFCMVDGLPQELDDSWRSCIQKTQETIDNYAKATSTRPDQTLRTLREENGAEFIQWCAGGPDTLRETAVLFALLCQLSRELGRVIHGPSPGIEQAQERLLREMRIAPNQSSPAACPPQGREHTQQLSIELRNIVRPLSQAIAPFIIHGFPLTRSQPGRVMLLRGFGNAIVPELAAHFIQASFEAIESMTA